jgi:hypothetical protein
MSTARDISLTVRQQMVKRAFRKLVETVGGQELAADYLGLSQSVISDYCNINTARFAPANVIIDLEAVTHEGIGHPIMTRLMARMAGYAVVALPQDQSLCPRNVMPLVAAQAKESGDITANIIDGLADGTLDAAEAAAARARVAELMQLCASMDAALTQIAEG